MTHIDDDYILGHDEDEIERLEYQAALLAPATKALLTLAGVSPGMRVLDLGTGAGDVALLAGDLVGPTGTVVGVDRSPDVVAIARARAAQRAASNVQFTTADVHDYCDRQPFDAVVERLALLYTPDPTAVLRHHITSLRPGAVVLAMEYDLPTARAVPTGPLTTTTIDWVLTTFRCTGLDVELGARLGTEVLPAAGVDPVQVLGVQPHLPPHAAARMLAGIVRTTAPAIEAAGVATAADIDLPTLETRLTDDLRQRRARLAAPVLVGAWATIA
jgi:SAM-dependent methyltransferase